MERRRKKPDGHHYGFWHHGRHADEPILESPNTAMALESPEAYGETSIYPADTLTFPQRRAPLWVVLSVLTVAALISGMVVIQLISNTGGTPPTGRQDVAIMPSETTAASPQTARTVRVPVPGPTTTVRVPVPGPTVTASARPTATPSPVPGPTVKVTVTAPASPAKVAPSPAVTVTKEVPVPGPTVTVTKEVQVPCPLSSLLPTP